MNRREHAVLSLFYDEGHSEVTASFLAYRMRMRASEATNLLDSMVREGILDLHIGDDGHLSYKLPPGEAQHIARNIKPLATREDWTADERGPASRHSPVQHKQSRQRPSPTSTAGPEGTDALVGNAPQSHGFPSQRNINDGTDGSVDGFGPHYSSVATGQTVRPEPRPLAGSPHQAGYSQVQIGSPQASPSTNAPHDWRQQGVPPHQALARRTDQPPTHGQQAYPDRIPILAAGLSLLFPGMGQFYNGEFGKGFLLMFSTAFLWVFFLFWIVWIWSVIDAYMVAEARNQMALTANEHRGPRGLLPDPRSQNRNSNVA